MTYRFCLMLPWMLFLANCGQKDDSPPKQLVTVKVSRAELRDVSLRLQVPATLFPKEQANLAARLVAPIRALKARKGDNVAEGQLLAVLENADIQAQCLEARAEVAGAQASLERLSAGTLVADVERARGHVATAQAALNQAQKIYDRRSELYAQGAIPQRDLLLSETELAQARTSFEVAQKSLDLLEQQSRGREIRQAESRLSQAKAHLQLTEAQLQFTELRSPFAGSITEQFLYPGDMAKPEAPIFTIMDLSTVVARAQVPEEQSGSVRVGQTGDFIPSGHTEARFTGRVSVVNKAVDTARRSVEVWCEIPNSGHQLRGGAFGNLSILTGIAPKSVTVPVEAIQFREGTAEGWVLVVDKKHIAHKVEVVTGEIADGKAQIRRGLKGQEVVIVEGGYALPDGAEVRITEEPNQ